MKELRCIGKPIAVDKFSETTHILMSKLSPKDVQPALQLLIEQADALEPALASRLKEINRWIKNKPPGLLMRKRVLLNFLTEIIFDAELWLGFRDLTFEEQEIERDELSAIEKYWYFDLFPRWFNEPDPKLDKWKREILKDSCDRDDETQLGQLAVSVEFCRGQSYRNMILDFSMATDLIVSGSRERPLCIQLTISDQANTEDKVHRWKDTLDYWNIKRALFISYHPRGQYKDSRTLAALLINQSDLLPYECQKTHFV
jgi:hypothetical protein